MFFFDFSACEFIKAMNNQQIENSIKMHTIQHEIEEMRSQIRYATHFICFRRELNKLYLWLVFPINTVCPPSGQDDFINDFVEITVFSGHTLQNLLNNKF